MARHRPPRRITLGGRTAVALPLEEYEQLLASRRQVGGQSARLRVLAQQVKHDRRFFDELAQLVSDPANRCCQAPNGDARSQDGAEDGCSLHIDEESGVAPDASGCLRRAVAALLRRHRSELD
ncbi:hypothetical protein [Streptomyces lunalinharesii]|uniref:Uncharacterized protein n=1 Tax=Streptomyces lunalinharesii TaxID=333384 RepID=A0ABP6E5Z1_9ACTN